MNVIIEKIIETAIIPNIVEPVEPAIEPTTINEPSAIEEAPIEIVYKQINETLSNEKQKSYYQMNKERIKAQQKIKISCPLCGRSVRKYTPKEHQKSKICLNNRKPAEPIINDKPDDTTNILLNLLIKKLFETK